jgi:hypothetical protein
MRCEYGKGYFVDKKIIYIGKDGSVSIEANGEIMDFPVKTIKFCPWCGKRLHPTEKGGLTDTNVGDMKGGESDA